jgi:hypothetical protein
MLCETHTKRVLFPTHCSVEFLPFKEAGDCPFPNVDFEVSSHEKSPNKVELSLFSSGKLSWTFSEAYRFSTFFSRRLCVRSRAERAERAASGASPCVTVM